MTSGLPPGAVPESATVVAKRVNLDLATAALRGALAFDRIEIVDPSVSWIAGGRTPASRVPHTTRTDSRPVIIVGRLDVVNLDATVSTASSLRLTVQGLSASLRGDVQGRLVGEIHADRGIRLEAEGVAGMLDRVTADVTMRQRDAGHSIARRRIQQWRSSARRRSHVWRERWLRFEIPQHDRPE